MYRVEFIPTLPGNTDLEHLRQMFISDILCNHINMKCVMYFILFAAWWTCIKNWSQTSKDFSILATVIWQDGQSKVTSSCLTDCIFTNFATYLATHIYILRVAWTQRRKSTRVPNTVQCFSSPFCYRGQSLAFQYCYERSISSISIQKSRECVRS